MAASIVDSKTQVRVSSVLNRDVKQFGKKFLFDGQDDTCWNSDQGSPQWIEVKLEGQYVITELHIQFQGGFAGRDCVLQGLEAGRDSVLQGSETSKTEYKKMLEFYPGDSNSLQGHGYHSDPLFSDRQVRANSADPDSFRIILRFSIAPVMSLSRL